MSHFTVLVPAKDESDLIERLAPFNEQPEPDDQYVTLEFDAHVKADSYEENARQILDRVKSNDHWKDDVAKYQALFDSGDYEAMFADWFGECKNEETGDWGYWYNPKAKWDWYVIGGRWTGLLKFKTDVHRARVDGLVGNGRPGVFGEPNTDLSRGDYASAGLIDWDGMLKDRIENKIGAYDLFNTLRASYPMSKVSYDHAVAAFARWEKNTFAQEQFPNPMDYIHATAIHRKSWEMDNSIRDRIAYVDISDLARWWMPRKKFLESIQADALTFAFIDLDGNWNEKEQMGWWGLAYEADDSMGNQYEKAWWEFVKTIPDDMIVYIVDCHI